MKKTNVNVMINIIIEHAWICLSKQGSEHAWVLNILVIERSSRSVYNVLSTYRDMGVFRTLSDI